MRGLWNTQPEKKMSFDNSKFRKLVKQFHGWIESGNTGKRGIARFPSVYLKDEFLKALAAAEKNNTKAS